MTYAEMVLETDDLGARYGDALVFAGVTIEVGPGVLALLGPNGAGKTTLVRILTTLRPPDSGTARVCGIDVARDPAGVRERISAVGQFAAVDAELSGRENLVQIGKLLGLSRRGARVRADELLEEFELTDVAGRRTDTWSGGQRRRLDIAAALVRTVPLLFLDEPTTGMDLVSRQRLWSELGRLAAAGTSIILTTQYLEEAAQLADRVLMLARNAIVADGSPDELTAAVGAAVLEIRDSAGRLIAEHATDGTAADLRRLTESVPDDLVIDVRRPTLDDAYLHLTEGRVRDGALA